jgi:hypothetical protein
MAGWLLLGKTGIRGAGSGIRMADWVLAAGKTRFNDSRFNPDIRGFGIRDSGIRGFGDSRIRGFEIRVLAIHDQ